LSYLLDTNSIIAFLKGRPASVRTIVERNLQSGVAVYTSSIVMLELWYGVAKSTKQSENAARLQVFASGRIALLPFDPADARIAGEVRNMLRARGTPIGPYDVLIAGQALRRNATLVTSNVREFRRVEGLVIEDWTATSVA
jgi:tRNA(fMet)-specific endonuclease VapC